MGRGVRRLVSGALGLVMVATLVTPVAAQTDDEVSIASDGVVQTAVISDSVPGSYLNLSTRGGRPPGGGVDGDGPPPLQQASMSATFANFSLNGISFATWQACRVTENKTVDECLATLGTTLRQQHPGEIGGDTFAFDLTITNTSPTGGPVLTTFAFQSKFSESPALGSRIGDKLFSARRDGAVTSTATDPLIGVKKNGTTNGLFRDGKVKGICINSSDDYPSDLNLGIENETLECTGGRTFNRDTNWPQLQAADGTLIDADNIKLPKGLLPGESMTMRLLLDAGTDDGALEREHSPNCAAGDTGCLASVGPLVGTLKNVGQQRTPDKAAECLELNVQPGDNVLDVVDFGDVKIIRDAEGKCAPSFDPFSKNQFLTIPRRNWGFTDILDTRDDYLPGEDPSKVIDGATPADSTGKFSFLDFDNLRPGEMNFFEILRGFGEFGETLDPSCKPGGSRQGTCGGSAYIPWAEFYALSSGKLVRQEVVGAYGASAYTNGPRITATVATGTQPDCRPNRPVTCKTTDPFETPGVPNPGNAIGASATATFSDVLVISDDKTTVENEGGQAGGDRVRFTVNITNTSPAGSNIYLTSFNFQTKQRGLTDINVLDGTSIQGRQDLRKGADGTLRTCDPDDPTDADCFDSALGIGRYPNVIGNSLLSSTFAEPDPLDTKFGTPDQAIPNKLEAIKKNGTFQPLMRTDFGVGNFICIKSGPPSPDQDADETCSGTPGKGLLPGGSQSVRLEMDYGDFRGLILRVAPGTLVAQPPPFGLLEQGGDFDCRDQRRLPFCHPSLVGQDWFTQPTTLGEVEFVTVHQAGDAATVMEFEQNFGKLLAMAGFVPTAEFYQGSTQMQVKGSYLNLPGVDDPTLTVSITSPGEGSLVSGTVDIVASAVGTVTVDEVEFFVDDASIGVDTDGSDGWSVSWNTTSDSYLDGDYELTAVARGGGITATSGVRTVTVSNGLTVQIVQPSAGDTVSGTTTLVAQTTGLVAATGVSFSYAPEGGSSTPIGPASETSPGVWELAWDTTSLAAGDYRLTATATSGTDTATDTITVEIVVLRVTIVSPDDGAILTGTVALQAEVVSAGPVSSVEFFHRPSGSATATSLGTATFTNGLWRLSWDTTTVADTPLTKPATQDELSVVVNGGASDAIDIRISNMLTARIFLPDNQEDLRGYEDLEALVTSQNEVTSVRFDLYDISQIDQRILIPFGEASQNGEPIVDFKYGRPLGNPDFPTGSPVHEIGPATSEGGRWVIRDWDTKTVPDGTYGLVATAFDSAARKATYQIETYIVNDLKVMISAPLDGAEVRGFVALEARTSGLFPATGVTFDVNGTELTATEVTPGRWRAVWDARSATPGLYTITATATNIAAETATDSVGVTLASSGGELAAFFAFDWSNCTLLTCSFLDSSGASSRSWDFGDGNTSNAQNPTHTYLAPGVYTVTLTAGGSSYSRKIPVGNIGIDGFNSQLVSGSNSIAWTSSLKDFGYTVGEWIYVPVHWKTTSGSGVFTELQRAILFTPEEADGEVDEGSFINADDGVLFRMKFTEVQYRGGTGVFKGKVNLGLNVQVGDDTVTLGTNVDVTNTALISTGDFLNVWVVDPAEGDTVSGSEVLVRAAPETSVEVSKIKIEFFANDVPIGEDTDGLDGWTVDWDTTTVTNGSYQLKAVATGGGLSATSTLVTVTVNNSGQPAPTVTLTADPETIASGGSSTLTWSSTNATSCEASGGWTGTRATSGSESTGALTTTTTYTLTCNGPGGTGDASVTVTVDPAPTVTLTASSDKVAWGGSSTLTWSSTNAASCEASGGWTGTRATSGSESTGALTTTTTYTLTCTGPGGSAEASVTVEVGPFFTGSAATGPQGTWQATISVTDGPPNTLISGTWNIGGTTVQSSCTTNGSGSCSFTRTGIRNNLRTVTWTHTKIGAVDIVNGKTVTILRP